MSEWGPHQALLERRAKRGQAVPALDARPVLDEDLWLVWEAFCDLHQSRRSGPDPIAPCDVVAWLDLHAIDEVADRLEIYRYVAAMDAAWMEAWHKREQARADAEGRNRRPRGKGRRR